jgi:putative ABC transport system permease protein
MDSFLQDLRYGARSLVQHRGFAAITIVTLALGIGANTAIFSVVNAVLLRDLPFRDASRLVVVWESKQTSADKHNVVSPGNYLAWRDESKTFDDMAALITSTINLTDDPQPEELVIQSVSSNFFDVLGASPELGRSFEAADAVEGAVDVILISDTLWHRRFGGDPGIVGQTIRLNGRPQTIVGVMPPDFHLTFVEGAFAEGHADVWAPLPFTEAQRVPRGRYLTVVGRLEHGATLDEARAEMTALAATLRERYPDTNKLWDVTLVPLADQVAGDVRTPLLVLFGAVGFVLLIACANVANLLLMRAAMRRREVAVRAALGASRRRVVRQLLTESVLLASLGGALGLAFAFWGVDLLLALRPPDMISLSEVGIDYRVLAFTLAVSVATGLVFGIVPALAAARTNVNETLKEGGRGAVEEGGGRLRQLFVVAQVALALVLLVGAGLFVRSLSSLGAVDPGFDARGVLTARLQLASTAYPEDAQRVDLFRRVLDRVDTLPGVRSASVVSFQPFGGLGAATGFEIEGRPIPDGGERPTTDVSTIGRDFFETMRIPLVDGRVFDDRELAEASHVLIVNETMARKHWPNESPIGKRVTVRMGSDPSPATIVGVVGDVRRKALDVEPREMVYMPHPDLAYSAMSLVVRTDRDPMSLAPEIEREVRAIDPNLPLADPQPLAGVIHESIARQRFTAVLLAVFAGLAFALAAIGIYGVLAYSVAGRTREIAIRSALGAQRSDIVAMVVRQGMLLASIGVVLGLGAAIWLSQLVASLLFGVSATDAATYAIVASAFLAVAFAACLVPARRATGVDPASALR